MVARALLTSVVVIVSAACHATSASPTPTSSSSLLPPPPPTPVTDPPPPVALETATLPLTRAKSGREMLLPIYFAAANAVEAKRGPAYVVLDTGSSGLRLLASAAPPAVVKRSGKRNRHVYLGTGVVFEGEQGSARMRIGADPHHLVEMDVAVDLVDLVGCVPDKPTCWGKDGASGMEKLGFVGILGVGMRAAEPGSGVFNPFAQLPANYASGLVVRVQNASVTIGLTAEAPQGFARFELGQDPQRPALPNHAPAWDDSKLPVCFSFPKVTSAPDCAPTLLASGRTTVVWNTSTVPPEVVRGTRLVDGTAVKMELAGVFSWSTGLARDETEVGNGADSTHVERILGMPFFRDHDVLYALASGEIGVRDAAP